MTKQEYYQELCNGNSIHVIFNEKNDDCCGGWWKEELWSLIDGVIAISYPVSSYESTFNTKVNPEQFDSWFDPIDNEGNKVEVKIQKGTQYVDSKEIDEYKLYLKLKKKYD